MTPEEKSALAALMRRFALLMADRRALVTILRESDQGNRCPKGWEMELERLRGTAAYKDFLAIWEPPIVRLEEDAEIEALLPLLAKLSEGKLPN